MGKQQLLLLLLSAIIVGIAVTGGISAFNENRAQDNADALIETGLRLATDAQAWVTKSPMIGGPKSQGWANFTWSDIGVSTSGATYESLHGTWRIATKESSTLELVGENCDRGNRVTLTITGTGKEDIATETNTGYTCS